MHIASKLNVAILAVLGVGVVANAYALREAVLPELTKMEVTHAKRNHKLALDELNQGVQWLYSSTEDNAIWDDTYDFMNGENVEGYIAENFTAESYSTFKNFGAEVVVYVDTDGRVVWGEAYSHGTQERVPGLPLEIANLISGLSIGEGDKQLKGGFLQTSQGLMQVGLSPIERSDGSGPRNGTMVMARIIDIAQLAKQLELSVDLSPVSPDTSTKPDAQTLVTTLSVDTTEVLLDLKGKPVSLLTVRTARDLTVAGRDAIKVAGATMMGIAILAMLALWGWVHTNVVSRLWRLDEHLGSAIKKGQLAALAVEGPDDEIGRVTTTFNALVGQVNHLNDTLAERAFLAGQADWRMGTLHNLRNGLSPVMARIWKLENIFDAARLKSMRRALDELATTDLAPERREKIRDYLVGTAGYMSDRTVEVRELASSISGSHKEVLDIIGELEKFGRKDTETGPLDLLPIISEVAETSILPDVTGIQVILPASGAGFVRTNRIIVRQVLTNLLINAREAIADTGAAGRISITMEIDKTDSQYVCVEISDNGPGIAADRLKAIFQRGVSSKPANRSRGLGLHWCANAMKNLSGSIEAQSQGLGHGSTFVLRLPACIDHVKEAA